MTNLKNEKMKKFKVSAVLFSAFIFMSFSYQGCEKVTMCNEAGDMISVYEIQVADMESRGYSTKCYYCKERDCE